MPQFVSDANGRLETVSFKNLSAFSAVTAIVAVAALPEHAAEVPALVA